MVRIVEYFDRCLKRDPMEPPVALGFGNIPRKYSINTHYCSYT